jgi:multicomponent Na+:H+ antiporter subunit G
MLKFASILLMAGGLFFFLIGTIGLIRLPDALTRAHGAAKCDTLGALLCITALLLNVGISGAGLKLILIILFVWMTNPTATHLIARGILKQNSRQKENPHADL